ncbi:hypothetical protein [Sediminicoccus rosea]|uniref:Uncharacterized protein n=1 Tax=Sediminicoccus rosea TaxID=1225128 RepID=A0ABZ0PDR6_9PROT|nr:hypothetical protein [Sediminicoccus rosea]WPB83747.1 hypothetical protein R9Z33_16720 [Sediminicoccus rosea]
MRTRREFRLTFGTADDQTAPWTDIRSLTWSDICGLLTRHQIGPKKGTCIVPACFRGKRRKKVDADRIEIAMLDSDAGATLDEIAAALRALGWAAIISSTHSHLSIHTTAKRLNWDRFKQAHGDTPDLAQAFLQAERSYLPGIAVGARLITETENEVVLEHQPCPKFRVTIPLLHPWVAGSYPDQNTANAAWANAIAALAHALGLRYDEACKDTSRLFYLPRRPADAPPPETMVLDGAACDIFSLPASLAAVGSPRNRTHTARAADQKAQHRTCTGPLGFGFDFGHLEVSDPETGELFNLTTWASSSAAHFQIVDALKERRPDILLGKVADGTKHHIRCPNEEAHTQAGADHATFLVNASESTSSGFVIHCRHAHCTDRDRLLFLKQMIEQRWLTIEDLQNPVFLPGQPDPLPLIRIKGGALPEVIQQVEDALLAEPFRIYQRGGELVRPGRASTPLKNAASHSTPRIVPVEAHALVEVMSQAARWERFDGRTKEWTRIDAPLTVARTYLERRGLWRLPALAGVITVPTLRADGSILQEPGYDKATGLILERDQGACASIPDQPSRADASAALALLSQLVETFPFVDGASRSVALSAILTSLIRRGLPTAPLHAFSAPVPGSGKSMLVDLTSVITTGRSAAVIAQGQGEEELQKRLGALLLAGDQVIAIDNCEAPLGGEFLCALLTQPVVRARILGRSEAPELPTSAFITATGNNLVLLGDMTRRALFCQLDPQVERPELREFTSNPLRQAEQDRAALVSAGLTILRAYHVAGYPDAPTPLGSFEAWSRWVRGSLIWLGEADPVQTMETARETDPRLDALSSILAQWHAIIGGTAVSVRDLIEKATQMNTPPEQAFPRTPRYEFRHPDFREALLVVAGDSGVISSRRLGKWLAAQAGRWLNGLCIQRGTVVSGNQRWTLTQQNGGEHARAA